MNEHGYLGGAPILGEALALDLMNTSYSVRGKPAEGIRSPGDATAWIRAVADRLHSAGAPQAAAAQASADDADRLRELRTAARSVATAVVAGRIPADDDVASLNRTAALAPHWTSLSIGADSGATKTTETDAAPVDQVLGALASETIDLFTGTNAPDVRLCRCPGCVLFYLKDHPRREWCSPACGARVRAARAYEKRKRSS